MNPKQRFEIVGSYGDVVADAEGMRVSKNVPKEYSHILRYDVAEYRDWLTKNWPKDDVNADVISVDCLHIGFWWNNDGKKTYEPAVADARKHSIEASNKNSIIF